MKKKISVILLMIFGVSGWLVNIDLKEENQVLKESNNTTKKFSSAISMMYETSRGSGVYEESKDNSWPQDGYTFNSVLSKCENGSTLSWNDETKKVTMAGNVSDKCYVYFDVYVKPSIADVCSSGNNLSNCVKNFYNTYGSDISNIYYHKNLANSAEDSSYRYAGTYESVENYVCFGYDGVDNCPWDNMYRIIGVFNNQVKLIKADYAKPSELSTGGDYGDIYSIGGVNKGNNAKNKIGGYYWNNISGDSSNNIWTESRLNTINLNQTYLNGFSNSWQTKIASHEWKIGGNTDDNILYSNPKSVYQNEVVNPQPGKYGNNVTITTNKIGLMYLTDYMYGATPTYWTYKGLDLVASTDYRLAKNDNWMYMGLYEWTITRTSGLWCYAIAITPDGTITNGMIYGMFNATRPVFYLNSSIMWSSGSGGQNDPIRLA